MSYEQRVKEHFNKALLRSRTCLSLYDYVEKAAPSALDATDLLRSAVVLGVSALDYLVHMVIRLEIEDRVLKRKSISTISVPIELSYLEQAEFIKNVGLHVKSSNSYKSFISPQKIADGLKAILVDPWSDISDAFGDDPRKLKRTLTLIVDLRNRIAHEGDLNSEAVTAESYDIVREDVASSIYFIEKLGNAALEAVISRQSELTISGFDDSVRYPVNLRPTIKGRAKQTYTVHRLPHGCWHAKTHQKNQHWNDAARWVTVRRLARTHSLGCCQHCWLDEAKIRTDELQSLICS